MYSASHASGRKRPQGHSENLPAGTGINHKKRTTGLPSEVTSPGYYEGGGGTTKATDMWPGCVDKVTQTLDILCRRLLANETQRFGS